jgi:hypothetical protein
VAKAKGSNGAGSDTIDRAQKWLTGMVEEELGAVVLSAKGRLTESALMRQKLKARIEEADGDDRVTYPDAIQTTMSCRAVAEILRREEEGFSGRYETIRRAVYTHLSRSAVTVLGVTPEVRQRIAEVAERTGRSVNELLLEKLREIK